MPTSFPGAALAALALLIATNPASGASSAHATNGLWMQADSNDVVWRNADSGRLVVWHLDFYGNRTNGLYTTPDSPSPTPTAWTILGPR